MSEPTLFGQGPADPSRVIALLEREGWQVVGARAGAYARLLPPGGQSTVLVPLDPTAPDFPELFEAASRAIAASAPGRRWAGMPSPAGLTPPLDRFEFRRSSPVPSGFIPWTQGEALFAAARGALASAAKASRELLPYFGNRHGQFATRYLDQVLMGQTQPGSFAVTAYSSPETVVPVQASSRQQSNLVGRIETVAARAIAQVLARSVAAELEAVEHARRTGSLSGFRQGVRSGVSYELTTALIQLTDGAEHAEVAVGFDPAVRVEGAADQRFSFTGADTPVLSRAAAAFVQPSESREQTVEGRVSLLTRTDPGGPGVISIETLTGEPARKVRVRLSAEDYRRALQAHDEGRAVAAQGRLERDRNITWLYDARLVTVYPADDPRSHAARAPEESGRRGSGEPPDDDDGDFLFQ